jgi:hypothetical protein
MITIHNWLALTHIWLVYGVYETAAAGRWLHCLLVIAVVVASTLMHLSETKHHLQPAGPFLQRWSTTFLNIDRFFAVTVSLYFLWQRWPVDFDGRDFWIIRLAVVGSAATVVSELVDGLAYAALHTVWHVCIFTVLNCVA